MRTLDLTYSDQAILNALLVQHEEAVCINQNNFNALLDDARVPQGRRQQLQDLFAWLLYFHQKTSSVLLDNVAFNSATPFASFIDWGNVEHFVIKNILSGAESDCDKEIFFEKLRTMVWQADENAWCQFDLGETLRRLEHDAPFNCWPAEIRRLALFTLNINSASNPANFSGANLSGLDLSGIDVSYANFSNANLKKVNLSGALCNGSNFLNANLLGANLEKAVGFSACFDGANLNQATLIDADFYSSSFKSASLSNANLQRTNLVEADLSRLTAKEANFSEAKLDMSDCTSADFLCADFSCASLASANLTQASFICAEFNQAYLMDAIIQEAHLSEAIFDGAVLIGASLKAADLASAKLDNANIERGDLTGACLCDATFHGANLTNTIFVDTEIDGADFSHAHFGSQLCFIFTDAEFSFDVLNDENLDKHFNHLDNDVSTLLSIHGVSDQYQAQKVEIIGAIIGRLHQAQRAGTDLSGVVASLADFFFSHHIYHQHQAIADFLNSYLIPDRITHGERAPLGRIDNIATLKMLSYHLLKNAQQPDWLLQHQGLINQLLVNLRLNQETFDLYTELKTLVCNHALVKQVLSIPVAHLLTGDEYFFVHPNGLQVFVCDEKLLVPIAMNASVENGMVMPLWSAYWFFTRSNLNENFELTKIDSMLDEVLHPYTLLAHSYAASDPKGIRADFIRLVLPSSVVSVLDMPVSTRDYGQLFLDDCQRSSVGEQMKLTSFLDQSALAEKFNTLFIGYTPPMIKPEHTNQIWLTFLSKTPALSDTPYHRSVLLFSLATFYTHACSSQIFGEELDSPQILRLYASGLLREAYSLAPNFFDARQENAAQIYDEWQNKLLGRNREFTCTAILSEKMISHIDAKSLGNHTVEKIFIDIYPMAWR